MRDHDHDDGPQACLHCALHDTITAYLKKYAPEEAGANGASAPALRRILYNLATVAGEVWGAIPPEMSAEVAAMFARQTKLAAAGAMQAMQAEARATTPAFIPEPESKTRH